MKKYLAITLMIIMLFLGAYSFIDLIKSLWIIFKYEHIDLYTIGSLSGRVLFIIILLIGYRLSRKWYRTSRA